LRIGEHRAEQKHAKNGGNAAETGKSTHHGNDCIRERLGLKALTRVFGHPSDALPVIKFACQRRKPAETAIQFRQAKPGFG
jgi:hypothetical protein